MWKGRVANSFEAFPQLNSHVELAAETIDMESSKHCIDVYLRSLHDQFGDYFGDVIQKTEHAWICDQFVVDLQQFMHFTLDVDEESEVIQLQHDHLIQGSSQV